MEPKHASEEAPVRMHNLCHGSHDLLLDKVIGLEVEWERKTLALEAAAEGDEKTRKTLNVPQVTEADFQSFVEESFDRENKERTRASASARTNLDSFTNQSKMRGKIKTTSAKYEVKGSAAKTAGTAREAKYEGSQIKVSLLHAVLRRFES
eukprot:SAG31_NODE_936_length_10870_cov_5.136966_6_plen_151_part_00